MRILTVFVLLASFAALCTQASAGSLLARWVQMAPGGDAEARAVVEGQACPDIAIDGTPTAMRVRAMPAGAFPVTLCAAVLPRNARAVSILGEPLPAPIALPSRIVVLGDTGCRIKGRTIQACNDAAAWPFPQVAAQAAKLKPDLVIHVGDYLYRESACPQGQAECAGSPWGDNWATWNADFFAPAAPLLAAAPWVIVRGNHEECARAGTGFLRFLGPLPVVEGAPCTEHVMPYPVPLGDQTLIVMDNANAVDRGASQALVDSYRADFESVRKLVAPHSWLVMHHPIWGVVRLSFGVVVGGNTTLMQAEDGVGLPTEIDLMLAGHIHTFEAINYAGGLPPQIIAGEGGDLLDSAPPDLSGQTVDTAKITDGLSLPGHGFLLLTRDGAGWRIDVFDAAGAKERICSFADRRIVCTKE